MKKLSLLCFAIFLVIVSQAIGDAWWWSPINVEINPAIPTTYDVVAITIGGWWGSSCIPIDSDILVTGNEIYFDVIAHPPSICLTVITPWERTESVGPLSLGTYTVYARLLGDPFVPETYTPVAEFNVTDKQFVLSPQSLTVPEGQTATFTVALLDDPCETVEVIISHQSGDTDIAVQSGEVLIFNSSNYSNPQTVTLMAAEDEDYFNGEAVILVTTPGFVAAQVNAIESDNYYVPPILYVGADAPGANNGASWTDAFTDLQEALDLASYVSVVEEIRVAQGFYTPAEPGGNPGVSFELIIDVVIKGGYAGFGEPDPNDRNIRKYETILSGDLNGDDDLNFINISDNSYHVVMGSGILDGFTITGGKGGSSGGGMYNSGSSTVINCTFIDNSAAYGGGIVCTNGSSLTALNCTFSRNSVSWYGGAIESWNADSLTLTNCIFRGNSAGEGGGVYSFNTNCTLINCIFTGNSAKGGDRKQGYGGGIYNEIMPFSEKAIVVTNCTFVGNSAVADTGGGIYHYSYYYDSLIVTNSILWDNSDASGTSESAQIYADNKPPVINYCSIQGLTGSFGGSGNHGEDPLFLDPDKRDYHLLQGSPCIDVGDNSVVEANSTDLDGNPRIINGIVDMGAYEFNPNTAPVANAGANQIVYLCADGAAQIELDGSGSTDADSDELEYLWTWEIEGTVFDANGVSPIIDLPVGLHTIELTVDDGVEVSEPNLCVIEVIGGIEVDLQVMPRVINRKSHMRRFLAVVQFPAGFDADDIDGSFWLYPGQIEPQFRRLMTVNGSQKLFMVFDKSLLLATVPANGPVVLEIEAQLISGRCLYGSDRIKIIRRGRGPKEQNGRRKGTHFRRNRVKKSR